MLRKAFITLVLLGTLVACQREECIDCLDANGNLFTFCDPAEVPLEGLECGEKYKKWR